MPAKPVYKLKEENKPDKNWHKKWIELNKKKSKNKSWKVIYTHQILVVHFSSIH